ncbi:MAG: glycosyltransferase family 4 protein [Hyphomicrobiaceae bacterium]
MRSAPERFDAACASAATHARLPLRVLLVNFTLDRKSPVLAWQAAVAERLAARVAAVHVFTEWLGDFEPPPGLTLDAMPHRPLGVPRRLGAHWLMLPRLRRIIDTFRPDVCFVHMAHEWCYRIGPLLRSRGVPILLWYAHGAVTWRLHLSTRFASRIVTSTPEGFRIATPKKRVIGQAIDTELFAIPPDRSPALEVVTVGRMSRRKRVDLIVAAMAHVVRRPGLETARLVLAGPGLTGDDEAYGREIEARIVAAGLTGHVRLAGRMTQAETARLYRSAAVHVNVSETGSMDKTVMEALSAGCPVLTSNIAFRDVLADHAEMLISEPTPESLADRIADRLVHRHEVVPEQLRRIVAGRHDLDGWLDRIVSELADLAATASGGTPAGRVRP